MQKIKFRVYLRVIFPLFNKSRNGFYQSYIFSNTNHGRLIKVAHYQIEARFSKTRVKVKYKVM